MSRKSVPRGAPSRGLGRRAIVRLVFVLPAVVSSIAFPASVPATGKLNVLFIISDDLRTELGCYGSPIAKTPSLDALATAGVRFDRAYCQFPLCNPSRASMLNGRYPCTTGVLGNRADFRAAHPDWISLPQFFNENGYVSFRAGKIFHGGIDDPKAWSKVGDTAGASEDGATTSATVTERQTRPSPPEPQLTQAQRSDRRIVLDGDGESDGDYRTADRTIAFLRQNKDRPFFIGCGFAKPHSPPAAPKRFYDLYDAAKMPLPPDFAPRPTVPEGFPRGAIRPRNADLFIGRDATPEEAREMIRAYVASVSWMDWNVGRVLAELDKLGLRSNTIIVFWGDNGYQLGEKGKWSKAGSVFEEGARIPLIIVAPGARGNGQMCPRLVESIDIYPTLAELCGLPPPKGLEGRSLTPLLGNPKAEWNHPAYTIWSEDGRNATAVSVRIERWRYAEFDGGRGGAMLLDLRNDPRQLKNLADDLQFAQVRADLSALVRSYAARYRATP